MRVTKLQLQTGVKASQFAPCHEGSNAVLKKGSLRGHSPPEIHQTSISFRGAVVKSPRCGRDKQMCFSGS